MSVPQGGVWVDARPAQGLSAERGVGRFVGEHIAALLELAPELIGGVCIDPELPTPSPLEPYTGSGKLRPLPAEPPAPESHPAIWHVTGPFEVDLDFDRIWPPWLRESECRLVVTLHDLIPLALRDRYFSEDADWGPWTSVWVGRLGLVRAADHVVTNSRHTAKDAKDHLEIADERITVIHSGVSDAFSSLVGSDEEAKKMLRGLRRLRPGFLLYVGGDDPRKNLEGTIRAYALLPKELRRAHQLVIVCKIPFLRRRQLSRYGHSLGIRPRDLLLTGFVPDPELAALYRTCELLIFPSLYEGAGLPILEAMSCGAPVAASNTSSIPELLGDLEGTFDPEDPADIARSIREILEDPAELDRLRERSPKRVRLYSWERVAEQTLEAYERALGSPTLFPASTRVPLAVRG